MVKVHFFKHFTTDFLRFFYFPPLIPTTVVIVFHRRFDNYHFWTMLAFLLTSLQKWQLSKLERRCNSVWEQKYGLRATVDVCFKMEMAWNLLYFPSKMKHYTIFDEGIYQRKMLSPLCLWICGDFGGGPLFLVNSIHTPHSYTTLLGSPAREKCDRLVGNIQVRINMRNCKPKRRLKWKKLNSRD